MKDINYEALTRNIDEMINILEYDSMRSGGKAKINAGTLNELYVLQERYAKVLAAGKKPAPKKAVEKAAE